MVDALRALLREALRDPLNQRFQLLCEYSLPLQSPLLVYQQFVKEPKSRLNACNTFDWQEHVRWQLSPCLHTHVLACPQGLALFKGVSSGMQMSRRPLLPVGGLSRSPAHPRTDL